MRIRSFAVLAVLWGSTAGSQLCRAQAKPWWGELVRAGPFPVGFATEIIYDDSRGNPDGKPRWVQLGVWYPSTNVGTKPLTFGDYVRIAAAETTSTNAVKRAAESVDAYRAFLVGRGIPEQAADAFLDAPLYARRNAPSNATSRYGSQSLLLLAEGNGQSAADQAVLGEYLASYGYVVLTSPSQARITGRPRSDDEVGSAAEDQLADLWILRNKVRNRSGLRSREGLAVIGHSFGARTALLYAMSDLTAVKAIVSLDGGIGTATARESFESAHTFVESASLPPLLHVYEELDPAMTPDWTTFRQLTGAKGIWLAKTADLHHHHFTTLGAASARFPELGKATGAGEETGTQYAAVLRMTRAFIDANLRGDSTALKLEQNNSAALRLERLP